MCHQGKKSDVIGVFLACKKERPSIYQQKLYQVRVIGSLKLEVWLIFGLCIINCRHSQEGRRTTGGSIMTTSSLLARRKCTTALAGLCWAMQWRATTSLSLHMGRLAQGKRVTPYPSQDFSDFLSHRFIPQMHTFFCASKRNHSIPAFWGVNILSVFECIFVAGVPKCSQFLVENSLQGGPTQPDPMWFIRPYPPPLLSTGLHPRTPYQTIRGDGQ